MRPDFDGVSCAHGVDDSGGCEPVVPRTVLEYGHEEVVGSYAMADGRFSFADAHDGSALCEVVKATRKCTGVTSQNLPYPLGTEEIREDCWMGWNRAWRCGGRRSRRIGLLVHRGRLGLFSRL